MNNNVAGQSLFEVVVALAVVGLTAIGIVRLSATSIKNARYASEETGAVAFAEKKIAELKAYSVNHKEEFWSSPYNENGVYEQYCYLVESVIEGQVFPTEIPRYSDSSLASVNAYVYWGLKDAVDPACSTPEIGLGNYERHFEISTLIAK